MRERVMLAFLLITAFIVCPGLVFMFCLSPFWGWIGLVLTALWVLGIYVWYEKHGE